MVDVVPVDELDIVTLLYSQKGGAHAVADDLDSLMANAAWNGALAFAGQQRHRNGVRPGSGAWLEQPVIVDTDGPPDFGGQQCPYAQQHHGRHGK